MKVVNCKICGKECKQISKHIKNNHSEYTAESYYNTFCRSDTEEGLCKVCGKQTRFYNIAFGYSNHCSQKCAVKNPDVLKSISEGTKLATEKIKKANMIKYGVEWISQVDSIKAKTKQTMLNRYGVEYAMQSAELRDRYRQSMLETYNVEYPSQNCDIAEKIKLTNIRRYGYTCPMSQPHIHKKAIKAAWSDEATEKRKRTNISIYGYAYTFSSPKMIELRNTLEIKQKRVISVKKSMLDKYGVTCGFMIPTVKEKAVSNTHSELAELKRIYTRIKNGNISTFELKVRNLFELNSIKYIAQYKTDSYPYLCDFYLPEFDLYVEVNGYWTHNSHWFDSNNVNDLNTINEWKNRNSKFFNNAIYTWTDLDVRKRQIAKLNDLNYVVLWTIADIDDWFALNCPIRKDWL